MALPLARLYDFIPGEKIISSQIDDEFNNIITEVNLLPEKDGVLQTNLNADLLDGLHAVDISAAAFPTGTKLLFYQAAPPSGWTAITPPTDHVLTWKTGVVGGTNAANSWTISGLSVTINGHVLTVSQMPSHTHNMNHGHTMAHASFSGLSSVGGILADVPPVGTLGPDLTSISDTFTRRGDLSVEAHTGNTAAQGSGNSHTHTGTVSQNGAWRPPAAYIIIASKD